jgi:hypothetical protein
MNLELSTSNGVALVFGSNETNASKSSIAPSNFWKEEEKVRISMSNNKRDSAIETYIEPLTSICNCRINTL